MSVELEINTKGGEMENVFTISGFKCGSCVKLTQSRIEKIKGVSGVKVSLNGETKIMANRKIELQEIDEALKGTEYKVV